MLDHLNTNYEGASNIFVNGGLNTSIVQCSFKQNQGSRIFSFYPTMYYYYSSLFLFYPTDYFFYSMAPLINVKYSYTSKGSFVAKTLYLNITKC